MQGPWARASIVVAAAVLAGCGGRQGLSPGDDAGSVDATGARAEATLGPVDLTQAPPQLMLSCDHGVGQLAFDNPCDVGSNITGGGGLGFHATECHFSGAGHPVAWSFILPLSEIVANPARPLTFPTGLPTVPMATMVEIGGQPASVASAAGTVTFSRVDPTTRAFSASFKGTLSWKTASETFTCAVDGPFWGAPGNFE